MEDLKQLEIELRERANAAERAIRLHLDMVFHAAYGRSVYRLKLDQLRATTSMAGEY